MPSENFYYLSAVELNENTSTSYIEVLRVGRIHDRGFVVTPKMLEDYVRNFKENVYGTEIQINLGHNREGEAAGWIKELYVQNEKLMARVEWTELGREKVAKKLFKFVSAELSPSFPHYKDGRTVDNVFIGAALTNTPALKDQQPIGLSEDLEKIFLTTKQHTRMFEKFLSDLLAREKVGKADKALAVQLLSELAPEEQAKHKENMQKLAEKTTKCSSCGMTEKCAEDCETQYEGMSEEEKKKKKAENAAKLAEKDQKLAEMTKEVTTLSQRAARAEALEKENVELKEKIALQALTEDVEKYLVFSETVKTGFPAAKVADVTKFMIGLTETQRNAFKELIGMVQTVELGEQGQGEEPTAKNEPVPAGDDKKEDEVTKLTEKLMKENASLSIADAQRQAYKAVYKKT